MLKADPSRAEWSAKKWADKLGKSKTAILNTGAWKVTINGIREAEKQRQAENAVSAWEQ